MISHGRQTHNPQAIWFEHAQNLPSAKMQPSTEAFILGRFIVKKAAFLDSACLHRYSLSQIFYKHNNFIAFFRSKSKKIYSWSFYNI